MSTVTSAEPTKTRSKLKHIPLSQIKPPKDALRKVNQTRPEYIELVGSVKDKGILNPILVREVKDDTDTPYSIVEGLHRYSAASDAGLTEIPCQIMTMTEAETWEAQIIGNLHKIETRAAEYAAALARVMSANPTLTKKQLSAKLSKSTTWIDNQLKLTELPESAQKLINDGAITVSNGYTLANLAAVAEDEVDNFLNAAQTSSPSEFASRVDSRVRQIKAERKAGRTPGKPTEYEPSASPQKLPLIKEELNTLANAKKVLESTGSQTALDGWRDAIKWVLHLDPISIEEGRAKYEADKAAQAEAKEKRRQEREEAERKKAAENSAAATE